MTWAKARIYPSYPANCVDDVLRCVTKPGQQMLVVVQRNQDGTFRWVKGCRFDGGPVPVLKGEIIHVTLKTDGGDTLLLEVGPEGRQDAPHD
jgi:hypothetical protein